MPPSLGFWGSLLLECTLCPDLPSAPLPQEAAWPVEWFYHGPYILLVHCDNHHRPIVSLSPTPWGQGVFFFISGPAHSGCTFKFFCIHTPTSPKVEALQKLHRFVPISQDNLNFKTVWPDCEVMCSFQFGFRKHDCHFYSNHESRFGDYLFHLSWFQFTWMRSARRGTGSGRFCPCACEAQDIRKAFKKITYCV